VLWIYQPLFEAEGASPCLTNNRLKCDRNQPCQNCTKRGLSSSCTFIHAGLHSKTAAGIHKQGTGSEGIHSRIRNLEELVVSLMHKTAETTEKLPTEADSQAILSVRETSQSTSEHDIVTNSGSLGRLSINDIRPNYVGTSHWAAILDNVSLDALSP
jgi:hypothetical protein